MLRECVGIKKRKNLQCLLFTDECGADYDIGKKKYILVINYVACFRAILT